MTPARLAVLTAVIAAAPSFALAQAGGLIIERNRPDRAPAGVTPPPAQAEPRRGTAASEQQPFAPFVLREVRVDGSTAAAELVGAASRPFLGRTIDAAVLAEMTNAVAAAYQDSDIALYTVLAPQQDFADGVVRLTVIEGWIDNVVMNVEGVQKAVAPVRAYAAKLTGERPLRRSTLERYLSLIRDIPGLELQADLQRTDTPGAVRLALQAKQKRVDFGLAVNNRGTSFLGRTQVTADLTGYSLFRGGDRTNLTFATPTDLRQFQYYGLSHSQLLNAEGSTVQASAAYLRTRPRGIPLAGEAVLGGLQVAHPLIRRYDESLYLTGGIDGLNSSNALLGQTLADERTRVLRLAAAYGRTRPKTSYSASAAVSFGLNMLGARIVDARAAETGFKKLTGKVALDQALGTQFVVRLRGQGQYTADVAPASELLALGGHDYGRAFETAAVTGDYGYAGSAELAWVVKPGPRFLRGSELYGFVDGGKVWLRDRTLRDPGFRIASAGFGVRAAVKQKAVLQVEAARSIARPAAYPGDPDWRVVVSVRSML
jgi:hemolysin activation/secretion protein